MSVIPAVDQQGYTNPQMLAKGTRLRALVLKILDTTTREVTLLVSASGRDNRTRRWSVESWV